MEISYSESLELDNTVFVDVRSPGEFSHDHIPGSINIPIFNNEERSEIGTIYRASGRDRAILRGSEIAGGKLSHIINQFDKLKHKQIIVLCARGGMRSGSVAALLNSIGIKVFQLKNGYKGYRNFIVSELQSLEIKPQIFILQGLTGTGKTEIIRRLDNAIDLEDMAGHRSSIFGGIGLEQKSQKKFESQLIQALRNHSTQKFIVVEGESRKIGNLHIPDTFFSMMKKAPAILICAPMERRIDILFNEYNTYNNKEEILHIVKSLRMKLGKKNIDTLTNLFNEGKIRQFIELLLITYYDPLYSYSLNRMDYIMKTDNLDTESTIEQIQSGINNYINNS